MLKITCPTCGHHMGHVPEPAKVRGGLSPQEALLFDALLSGGEPGLSYQKMGVVLHGPFGGDRRNTVTAHTVFRRMKAKIEPFGYFIKAHKNGTRENFYSIIPAEYPS